MAISKANIPQ